MAKSKANEETVATPDVVVPAASPAPKATPAQRRWAVSLVQQPTSVVEAVDEAGAIAAYNALNGITQTDHQHAVAPL